MDGAEKFRPKKKKFVRRPIQLIQNESGPVLVLCNDGTMWYANAIDNNNIEWLKMPNIPQEEE